MKKIVVSALACIMLFSACSKDGGDDDCETTAATLAGSYKLTAAKYKASSSTPEIDGLGFLDACEKDDLYIIAANGDFSYQDAGTVCTPNGSYTGGSWTLSGNTINLDGLYEGIIESWNCTTLVFYQTSVLTAGDRLTVTFVRQ